jgi:hypothetical protein
MAHKIILSITVATLLSAIAQATVFGSVRGIVHDPQHRPVQGAAVTFKATHSDFSLTATTNENGEFLFQAVPIGEYSVTAVAFGFTQSTEKVEVQSGTEPVVHLALSVVGDTETVNVSGAPAIIPTDSATPTTLVSREDVERTPGADRTNSLAMITDYVPGAYFTHDQLHIRGCHQTSWLIDGVPVPNTNIASNLGPQLDLKDIDYLEVSRGSYGADPATAPADPST